MSAFVAPAIKGGDPSRASVCMDQALAEARQRGLQRTLQALFRERLLQAEHLVTEGAVSWLPLWSQRAVLRFENLQIGRIGDCQTAGSVLYYRVDEQPFAIATAAELLACVAGSLPLSVSGDDLQRLMRELENSTDNDALCLRYRKTWRQEILSAFGAGHRNFIAALRASGHPNPSLLLEQWGTIGHPWHPNYKTRLGLTPEEMVALSPEFQAILEVPVAAIMHDRVRLTLAQGEGDYRSWFARQFPQVFQAWEQSLAARHQDPEAWVPIPLHPYQAAREIPTRFAPELETGALLMLPGVAFRASPTMSFRTVAPAGQPLCPHVKLAVSLRLTSVQRTVSPKSTVMGPRVTQLLQDVTKREAGFDGRLDFLPEEVGLHVLDPENRDDRARHLAVLYRANPMSKASERLFPVPVGALFADSPFTPRPLVTDLVALSFGDTASGAERFFDAYTSTVLHAVLGAYLLYGIAFEAHQQNSFILVGQRHEPECLLIRDFGDLRVHGPTLRQAALDLVPYRSGHTVYESEEPVRDKLLHAVLLCHLGELGLLLARAYHLAEAVPWNVLRGQAERVFDHYRDRVEPQRWHAERRALLEVDWPAKSFLRMRLSDTSDDVHGTMPNPLRKA